jgi:uncharacterized protein (TIGR02646 family)
VNQRLLPLLLELTEARCAYCDHFPLRVDADPAVDHHRPKSRFPDLAFAWSNLYGVCALCNRWKADRWDDALLRPDEPGYDFFRYFDCDPMTGRIGPRPDIGGLDRERAARTIEILGLNEGDRPQARARAARGWSGDGAFRFISR